MSKATIAVIAAMSAGAGAAAATAVYSMRAPKPAQTLQQTTTTTTTSTTTKPPSAFSPSAFSPSAFSPPAPPTPPGTTPPSNPLGIDPSGLFTYGFPGPVSDLAIRTSLISSFDRRTRNPSWVAEHITPASLAVRGGDRKHSSFLEDASIPPQFRAKLTDYLRSGYDRGHQVPAADCKWSQPAMDDTFYLSNMCPQVGEGFNRDYWAHFEDFCRRLTGRYPSVRVVTGPLYLPKKEGDGKWYVKYEVIGSGGVPSVAVPTHFFKVIFGEDGTAAGPVAVGAFVLPNARIGNERSLKEFEVPLEVVERASGLEFAGKLPVQRRRRLCAEADCEILVKEYKERQKSMGK